MDSTGIKRVKAKEWRRIQEYLRVKNEESKKNLKKKYKFLKLAVAVDENERYFYFNF